MLKEAYILELIILGIGFLHGLFVMLGLALYYFQPKLIFKAAPMGKPVQSLGIKGLKELTFRADDGTDVVAWHIRPKKNMPTLLYLHGNYCNLSNRKDRIKRITNDGYGLFMISFRGYGRTEGIPGEKRNVADAVQAYDYLVSQGLSAKDIIIYGESLGGAVGTQVAASRKVAALLLESPFTSMVDMAARFYPFFPVEKYIRDRFETIKHIRKVTAPVMIIHSVHDELVPFEFGETLFRVAGKPKALHLMDKVGHYGLFRAGAWQYVREFIENVVVEQVSDQHRIISSVKLEPYVYDVINSKLPLYPNIGQAAPVIH